MTITTSGEESPENERSVLFCLGSLRPSRPPIEPPAFLKTLSTVCERAPSRAICVVLPRVTDTACCVGGLVALGRFAALLSDRIAAYARTEFKEGELVSVLPDGHVYEFGGVFEGRPFFKLRVLGRKDRLARSLPIDQILRLQRTDRSSPKGRETTPLGDIQPTPMEVLLGVRTLGNTAIADTEVLLCTSPTFFSDFLSNTIITKMAAGATPVVLGDVMPWGRINEEGAIVIHGFVAGKSLVGVSTSLDRVRKASDLAPENSLIVLVEGARRVGNLEHFRDIVARQRVLILAEQGEADQVRVLEENGVVVWQPSHDEILLGSQDYSGPVEELFEATRTANKLDFQVHLAMSTTLDAAAEALHTAESKVVSDTDPSAAIAIGDCFRLLVALGDWYLAPSSETAQSAANKLEEVRGRLTMVASFLPSDIVRAMNNAISAIKSFLDEGKGGSTKLEMLEGLLDAGGSSARRIGVVAANESTAQILREHLKTRWPETQVFVGRGIPVGTTYDSLILTAWPRIGALQSIVSRLCTPRIALIGYAYERRWFEGFVRRRSVTSRAWRIDGEGRVNLLGLPPTESGMPRVDEPAPPELAAALRLEVLGRPLRKGSEANPGQAVVEARYIGFCGSAYAYVTPSHQLVRVASSEATGFAVTTSTADAFRIGDRVLFRDAGGADVISMIAEEIFEGYLEARRTASRWRKPLRDIGPDFYSIFKRLKRHGLRQEEASVRAWLTDPDRIGPQNEEDIRIIADAAQDGSLFHDAGLVFRAISEVRRAHVAAGQRLTAILLSELPSRIGTLGEEQIRLELSLGNVWILQLDDISQAHEMRSSTEVNRLLWDDRFV